jgi:hypothetical protein
MLELLRKLFPGQSRVSAKPVFQVPDDQMVEIKKMNRSSLALVDDWIDETAFSRSFFKYGVPDFIKTEINKPVGDTLTYTDLMLFISRKHFSLIHYLEIGVSVGKNFFQLINAHAKGNFSGFDIEDINPVLEQRLAFKSLEEWETPSWSIKKNPSSFKTYRFNETEVSYLSADVWDENSWAKLKGNKFNMVFSDALHTPQAILFEFEMLVKYDLLDGQFVIFWDDLVGKMKNSFYKIIRKYDKVYKIQDIYLLNINGWVGENEAAHTVGIISNFNL